MNGRVMLFDKVWIVSDYLRQCFINLQEVNVSRNRVY